MLMCTCMYICINTCIHICIKLLKLYVYINLFNAASLATSMRMFEYVEGRGVGSDVCDGCVMVYYLSHAFCDDFCSYCA